VTREMKVGRYHLITDFLAGRAYRSLTHQQFNPIATRGMETPASREHPRLETRSGQLLTITTNSRPLESNERAADVYKKRRAATIFALCHAHIAANCPPAGSRLECCRLTPRPSDPQCPVSRLDLIFESCLHSAACRLHVTRTCDLSRLSFIDHPNMTRLAAIAVRELVVATQRLNPC